jgi:hypothetical protein
MTTIEVLWTPPQGNAYYILAHQWIAAKLNNYAGAANPTLVQAAIDSAHTLFSLYSPEDIEELSGNSPLRKTFIYLAGIIEKFNEGIIGPGECSEENDIECNNCIRAKVADTQSSGPKEIGIGVYPNPFNPSTTISFMVPESGHVTLKIYNVAGNEIATIVDAPVSPGRHTAVWNASDMPSGIYFARIVTGSKIAVQRLMLMK